MASLADFAKAYIVLEDKSQEGLSSFKRNIREAGDGVRTLQGYLAALGVTATAGGVALLIQQAVSYAAELDKLQKITGATVESLSTMREVAKLSGTDFQGTVVPAIQQLNRAMLEAQANTGKAKDALRALGLEVESGGKLKNVGDFLLEIAVALEKLDDNSRAGFAEKIVKGGSQLIPFLQDLVREGSNVVRITAEQAAMADQYENTLTRLGMASSAAQREFALGLLPVMNDIAFMFLKSKEQGGSLLETMQQLRREGTITEWARDAVRGLAAVADAGLFVVRVFRQLVESVAVVALDIANAFAFIAKFSPVGWMPQINNAAKEVGAFRDAFVERANQNMEERWTQGSMTPFSDRINGAFGNGSTGSSRRSGGLNARLPDNAAIDTNAKREAELLRAMVADAERLVKLQERRDQVLADFNQTQSETLQQLQFETSLIGKNEEERQVAIALRKLEQDYLKAQVDLGQEELETLRKIYDLQRARLPEAVRENVQAKERLEAARKEAEEWKRMVDDVGRSLTDRIVDRGVKGFSDLREIVTNMFKSMVLRPIIQPVVTGAAGLVGGVLGLPGAASAASLGGGMGGGMGGIGGLANMFGLGDLVNAGGLAGMGGGLIASLGGAIGGSFGAGLTYAGSTGALSGLSAAFGAGGMGGSAAFGLGAALPAVGWALAAYAIGRQLGVFGGGGGGPAHTTGWDFSGIASSSGFNGTIFGNAANSKENFRWAAGAPVDQLAGFNADIKQAYTDIAKLGESLGVNTSGLSSVSAPVTIGLISDASKLQSAMRDNIGQVTDVLARSLVPNLEALAVAGETATQTLVRLAATAEQLRAQRAQSDAQVSAMAAALPGRLGITSLEEFQRSLGVSESLSPLDRLAGAKSQYGDLLARARAGDLDAVQAFSGSAQQLLGVGRDVYASGADYQSIYQQVNADVASLIGKQRDIQAELLAGVSIDVQQAGQNTVAALREQTEALIAENRRIVDALDRLIRSQTA